MALGYNNPFAPSVGSFRVPVVAPTSDPDSGSQITVCFSADWLPFVIGALQQLALQATWQGDDSAILAAQDRAQLLIAMFGSSDGGCGSTVCIPNLRYDSDSDQVQETYDGGETWVDQPAADPRHATNFRFPVVVADDPQCKAAANMTRYISDLIDQVLATIGVAGTAEGLLAIILPLIIELGPFGVLIDLVLGLCFVLFGAGAAAIEAAFTSGVYDTLTCIFYCNIGADGRVTAAQLTQILSDVNDQIGGLVYTVLSGMFLLMGEVGLGNAGTIGDAPADCSGCDCLPRCHEWTGVGTTAVDALYTYRTFSSALSPLVNFTRVTIDWQLNPNPGAVLVDAQLSLGFGDTPIVVGITTTTGEHVFEFSGADPEPSFQIQVKSHYSGGSNYPDLTLVRFEYLPNAAISWVGGSDC